MNWFQVIVLLCVLYQNVNSYRILAVLPAPSKSHYFVGSSLMKGLAKEGHQVTVISPFKEKQPIANYTEVFLERSWVESRKTMGKNNFLDFNNLYFWNIISMYYETSKIATNYTLANKNLHDFIKTKQHFDVVVVEVSLINSLLAFGNHFNAPVVGICAIGSSKWTNDVVGTPNFPSYVPHTTSYYTDRMNFWQRMYNSLNVWYEDIIVPLYFLPIQQKAMEQLFPDAKKWPSIDEIRKNVSLVLLNTHSTIGSPRPYAPNMIEVGGIQIQKEIKPLPENIQKFLDEAYNGAIFVSLGSNILLNKLPKEKFEAITNAFRLYPNHRILIKCDEQVNISSHKASDVFVEPWFNQQSILAHKNIKLFVTHGGLLSTTEAVYFGKPIVGISFFFDQHLNMNLAEQKGFGVNVPIETLTRDKLAIAVKTVLGNPSYTANAQLISDRFRDHPLTPLETGIFWVKHVAKNGGAPHLRSVAVELTFVQLYNLDVWATIFGVLALAIFFLMKIAQLLIFFSNERRKIKKP